MNFRGTLHARLQPRPWARRVQAHLELHKGNSTILHARPEPRPGSSLPLSQTTARCRRGEDYVEPRQGEEEAQHAALPGL